MRRLSQCPELYYGVEYWIDQRDIIEVALRYLYRYHQQVNFHMVAGWLLSHPCSSSIHTLWDVLDYGIKHRSLEENGSTIGQLLANYEVTPDVLSRRLDDYVNRG